MPSNPDSRIEFRDIEVKTKIRSLNLKPNQFAKAAVNQVIKSGKCPVCLKSFEKCKYFQRLENQ
jgi:hypothetical protein